MVVSNATRNLRVFFGGRSRWLQGMDPAMVVIEGVVDGKELAEEELKVKTFHLVSAFFLYIFFLYVIIFFFFGKSVFSFLEKRKEPLKRGMGGKMGDVYQLRILCSLFERQRLFKTFFYTVDIDD